MKIIIAKYKYILLITGIILLVYIIIPIPKIDDPTSTVVYSEEGNLLGAKIADDGQWRFPEMDSIPYKLEKSILLFEDHYFKYHPGINPVSLVRALWLNIKSGEIVSGGSTITMQVIRLARKGKRRTIREKIIEMILATKLEIKYSKQEILTRYLSNAPFGGNVVGVEAASWRYYGRDPEYLSWAEAATLAVLPNSPSLIFPGKNQILLHEKRDKLLFKLLKYKYIDTLTYNLSLKEILPGKPKLLPQMAPHLIDRCFLEKRGNKINTTIKAGLQNQVNQIVDLHSKQLKSNEIHNIAAIVIDVETADIKAYIGNTTNSRDHGNDVDIIIAPRSTGSILKPILFASMLDDGELLSNSLVPDIPMFIDGFSPKNYNLKYDGAVPAKKALSRSLNVPAVYMLSNYGVAKFHDKLIKLGFSTINNPPDHYGLSLILGGAEATLWDLCTIYSGMARILKNSVNRNYQYSEDDLKNLNFYKKHNQSIINKEKLYDSPTYFSSASLWFTMEALLEVNRPENESGWKFYSSSSKIAWKTGTSFGFRDAWAIGITPEYVVGVWIGNADGEGRPGLIGVLTAAPVMFDIFNLLQINEWFQKPYGEIINVPVCKKSGFLPSLNCSEIDTVEIPQIGLRTMPCPYHKLISMDKTARYRVNLKCENPEDIVQKSWFVLPPAMEYYYKLKNPFYLSLPVYKPGCTGSLNDQIMEFIYPKESSKMYVPVNITGEKEKIIIEVAHRNSSSILFWHIDNQYIGKTEDYHQMAINPELGFHNITVVDKEGNSISRKIEIVSK